MSVDHSFSREKQEYYNATKAMPAVLHLNIVSCLTKN